MPEGHTLHREARLQRKRLVGVPLDVSSPQGRFSEGARALDGNQIEDIEAVGKHLFYWWDIGRLLHVHLGLFGRFRRHRTPAPPPTDGTRLAMRSEQDVLYLSGPTTCELIDPDERLRVVSRLGPDPLTEVSDAEATAHVREFLSRRKSSIARAMLDQSVMSGIGNVYRSEILFLAGIHPLTPSNALSSEQVDTLWSQARRQLRLGESSGRIVTTEPKDVGVDRRSEIGRGDRTYVYKRRDQPCRRCGTPIERTEISQRKAWWCPECQPA